MTFQQASELEKRVRAARLKATRTGLPPRPGDSMHQPGRAECAIVIWFRWPEQEQEFTDFEQAKNWLARYSAGLC